MNKGASERTVKKILDILWEVLIIIKLNL
jgi:hypothetical protein